jgi:hypothetical protein
MKQLDGRRGPMTIVKGLPRGTIYKQMSQANFSMIAEKWCKAMGLLYPNEKALITVRGTEGRYILLKIEIGLDKDPGQEKEVSVRSYGAKKKKKLQEGGRMGKFARAGLPTSSAQ